MIAVARRHGLVELGVVKRKAGLRVPAGFRQLAARERRSTTWRDAPAASGRRRRICPPAPMSRAPSLRECGISLRPVRNIHWPQIAGKQIRALAQTLAQRLGPRIGFHAPRARRSPRIAMNAAPIATRSSTSTARALRLVGDMPDRIERAPQMIDRLARWRCGAAPWQRRADDAGSRAQARCRARNARRSPRRSRRPAAQAASSRRRRGHGSARGASPAAVRRAVRGRGRGGRRRARPACRPARRSRRT